MTVWENLAFSLIIANAPNVGKDAKVAETARIRRMEHRLDHRPPIAWRTLIVALDGGAGCATGRALSVGFTSQRRTCSPQMAKELGPDEPSARQ